MMDNGYAVAENHAEEDENYFVSMTDMMVGILFIFIILLMVFALNFRQQTDVSEDQIKRLQEAAQQADVVADRLQTLQSEVRDEIAAINQSDLVRSELLQEIKGRLATEGLEVQVDEANGVLRLAENAVRFPVDSAELTAIASSNVAKIAQVLGEVLPSYTAGGDNRAALVETVFIEGHTDVTGDDERNWRLSTERAVNTYRLITQTQPALRELRNGSGNEVLSVSGYSSTRGVPDVSRTAYDVHRRIDLRFVMDVDNRHRLDQVLKLTSDMELRLRELQESVERANVR